MNSTRGPLDGLRVIELGGIGPAPFCTMLLADMGAEVVRVVRPGVARIDLLARGKHAVELDLKRSEDLDALLELVARADVVVEGFRPGVAERLGVGPETVSSRNPTVIYAQCTGWGQSGPLHEQAGHDINYIAMAGVLGLIGPANSRPVPPLNLVGDFGGGGLLAAFGILCALVERSRSGLGQVIDAAMVDGSALLATMFFELTAIGAHDEAQRGCNTLDGGAPYYDTYETEDGRWFAVGAVEGPFYYELLTKLGLRPDQLPDRHDPLRSAELRASIAAAFRRRRFVEWQAVFAEGDACASPVLRPSECAQHAHHVERASFVEVGGVVQPAPAPRFSRTPGAVRGAATTPLAVATVLANWSLRSTVR